MKHNPWTPEELDILRERYPTEGAAVSRYINHTPASCRTRARLLGLKFYQTDHPERRWSDREDNIIRSCYPTLGSKTIANLPGRTKNELFARAIRLGVKFKRGD